MSYIGIPLIEYNALAPVCRFIEAYSDIRFEVDNTKLEGEVPRLLKEKTLSYLFAFGSDGLYTNSLELIDDRTVRLFGHELKYAHELPEMANINLWWTQVGFDFSNKYDVLSLLARYFFLLNAYVE